MLHAGLSSIHPSCTKCGVQSLDQHASGIAGGPGHPMSSRCPSNSQRLPRSTCRPRARPQWPSSLTLLPPFLRLSAARSLAPPRCVPCRARHRSAPPRSRGLRARRATSPPPPLPRGASSGPHPTRTAARRPSTARRTAEATPCGPQRGCPPGARWRSPPTAAPSLAPRPRTRPGRRHRRRGRWRPHRHPEVPPRCWRSLRSHSPGRGAGSGGTAAPCCGRPRWKCHTPRSRVCARRRQLPTWPTPAANPQTPWPPSCRRGAC
mmetsp:Transcript_148521/g.458953  ORF Transcript_148521/g.458953 Transcript_148521/m.458953 type:complete len:263 (-) Transcript_148521:190-978(-)